MNAIRKVWNLGCGRFGLRCIALVPFLCITTGTVTLAVAQSSSSKSKEQGLIQGTVADAQGKPLVNVTVNLEVAGTLRQETKSDSTGTFQFKSLAPAEYSIDADKPPLHAHATVSLVNISEVRQLHLVLKAEPESHSHPFSADMEFSDNPDFTVAGVTDWTAVGGHGSDIILRTSEDLARETLSLKPSNTETSALNTEQAKLAEQYSRTAKLAEKAGDPLTAVNNFQQAAKLDPSEQNYFDWGSELLLHRAIWQAVEVFHTGTEKYPKSARMLTALGTALFAGARYDEAAQKLCDASDLDPAYAQPYLFMGKVVIASPNPLPCIETRLARFAQNNPNESLALYLYATSLEKGRDPDSLQRAETLFEKTVQLDPKCADAYFQIGVIYADRRVYDQAIRFYKRAIALDPALTDAHYRLAVAYDRSGQPEKAKLEFKLHDDLEKEQAAEKERQRREVKQFKVLANDRDPSSTQ